MRYAVFTDIHANLEALEAVLAKIDEIAAQEPIDEIWFLGDLVGYGPDPNECIVRLRERTDVIIAGNHDWAAVGKIDLEDFSPAARISAEWTAETLTGEHRTFLENLPERLDKGECTLVHGSPYGPLWEYLTREDQTLAERSFEYFTSRYCFVGHTHVPVIFQQPDVASAPTIPLGDTGEFEAILSLHANGINAHLPDENAGTGGDEETTEMAMIHAPAQQLLAAQSTDEDAASAFTEQGSETKVDAEVEQLALLEAENLPPAAHSVNEEQSEAAGDASGEVAHQAAIEPADSGADDDDETRQLALADENNAGDEQQDDQMQQLDFDDYMTSLVEEGSVELATPESEIAEAEERLNSEIEELLTLLGLSQSMVLVTNEMVVPPEGHWELPAGYRAIVNPGGVGQPRDGDPRAAFMIYDTERGFEFYRVPYDYEKTQEKIINAGLPQFLAVRLQFGR